MLVEVELQSFLQKCDTTAKIARVEEFHPSQKTGLERMMKILSFGGYKFYNGRKNPVYYVWWLIDEDLNPPDLTSYGCSSWSVR